MSLSGKDVKVGDRLKVKKAPVGQHHSYKGKFYKGECKVGWIGEVDEVLNADIVRVRWVGTESLDTRFRYSCIDLVCLEREESEEDLDREALMLFGISPIGISPTKHCKTCTCTTD